MSELENRKVRIEGPVSQLRSVHSLRGAPGCAPSRPQYSLTRQIAAWRDSWSRIPDDDDAQSEFLDRVGRCLGESGGDVAVKRAREVLGITV
jgi:hypothetical protein